MSLVPVLHPSGDSPTDQSREPITTRAHTSLSAIAGGWQEDFLAGSSCKTTAKLEKHCLNSARSNGENEKHYLQNMLLLPTSIPWLFLSSHFDFFLQTPSANKTSRDGSWDKTRLQALQKLNTFITLLLRAPFGNQRAPILSHKHQRTLDMRNPC